MLAFGDSITNGGGELQWGVALQSWALWVARALGLPYTGYAVDGARAADVVSAQIRRSRRTTSIPPRATTWAALYIGVNDVRALDWDAAAFEADFRRALSFVRSRCDRTLAVSAPLRLGVPPAGLKVLELRSIVERVARELGTLVVDLHAFGGRDLLMADRVHPTAFGQIAIAECALAVLERDGLPTRVAPWSLIRFQTTRRGRLRHDWTYAYRSVKLRAEAKLHQLH